MSIDTKLNRHPHRKSMDLSSASAKNHKHGVIAAFLLLMLLVTTNSLAQINKCNINGKTVYTDKACPDDSASQLHLEPLNTTSTRTPVTSKAPVGDSMNVDKSNYKSAKWFSDHRGYARALKLSREQNVPIFIYAYTDWCGYCKKLKKEMFADSRVKETLSGYVKVKINPEHSAADQKLFKQWGGKGYPTLYIQPESDASPTRTSGPFTKQNGKWKLMGKGAFIGMLESNQ